MKEKLQKIAKNIYEIPQTGEMRVPARIFVSPQLLKHVDSTCLEQLSNAARLPGIVHYALGMSDVHVGYGLPIGGVIAFDLKKGVISPEAVGFDVNCGVRLLKTGLTRSEVEKKKDSLAKELFKAIPSGNGKEQYLSLSVKELDEVLERGLEWAQQKGYANATDRRFTEDRGKMKDADAQSVSAKAKERGRTQLGTLGSGNHFLEVQYVEKIMNKKAAATMGLKKDMVCVMIHSGSRGLGHEVAADYIGRIRAHYAQHDRHVLAHAPLDSPLGKQYMHAMHAAANFAFVNRQLMTHATREVFASLFSDGALELVYDLAHNIAKFEQLELNGKKTIVCVHRKGATRSFGPGRAELPNEYKKIGGPIFLPGSMGTASFVLVGTSTAERLSLASAAHGAGRVLSRSAALERYKPEDIQHALRKKGIILKARSEKSIPEEAPEVYKDVDEVARVTTELGLARAVARLRPLVVIKG